MTPRSVGTTPSGRGRPATRTRVAAGGVAAGAVLALVAGVGAASTASAEAPGPHKSYVCKYVSKPGESERLQTGQNPIWVDNHSLLGYDGTTYVGQEFKDGQFRSVVIVANTRKLNPEPSVADCPQTPPTTTTTTHTTTHTTTTTTTSTTTTTTTTPPTTGTTTTMVPTTTVPPTTTPATTSTTTPAAVPSTYPLQPVQGGVMTDTAQPATITPLQALLALVALIALWVALGAPMPRVSRPESPGGSA